MKRRLMVFAAAAVGVLVYTSVVAQNWPNLLDSSFVVYGSTIAMNPTSGVVGTTVNVAIDGLNFVSGSTAVTVTGTGVTVGAVTVVNPNQLTTTFTIASSATLGVRNVTVTTPVRAIPRYS